MQQRFAAARRAENQAKIAAANAIADASGQPSETKDVKDEQSAANATGIQPSASNGPAMGLAAQTQSPSSQTPRQPWDHVEEIMNMLKTAFPLLALTMEKMVDQISLRAKPASDEDIYRFFSALLADAMQQWGGRSGLPNDDGELNAQTKDNLAKFATNLNGELKVSLLLFKAEED